jgi:hypothetical protein
VSDLSAVDALCRLALLARRHGAALRVHHVSPNLRELIDFLGLGDALGLEPLRKAEQGEQAGRVEEEADPTDPIA